MIEYLNIKFEKNKYKSIIYIYFFILYNIIIKTININTVIFISLISFFVRLLFNYSMFFILLLIINIYILIALEETYHIAMIIFLGKKDTISHINITSINIKGINFIGGASVHYSGVFKKSDIFYISLAGPIMSIFFVLIIQITLISISFFINIDNYLYLKVITCSLGAPILALIPIKNNNYFSDGYRILNFIYTNNISFSKIVNSIIYTIKSMMLLTINYESRLK